MAAASLLCFVMACGGADRTPTPASGDPESALSREDLDAHEGSVIDAAQAVGLGDVTGEPSVSEADATEHTAEGVATQADAMIDAETLTPLEDAEHGFEVLQLDAEGQGAAADADEDSADTGPAQVEDSATEGGYPLDDLLRLNHIQVKGTHNSYHQAPTFVLHPSHNYTHPPLDVQLADYGVRAFELDVHLEGEEIEVYHIFWIDQETSCATFTACLEVMKGWSDDNPGHLPMMVWLEAKEATGGQAFEDLGVLDDVINTVFPPERLLTPDDVRGDHETLRAALESEGWPTLGEVRNRAMFMVLNGGSGTEAYTHGGQHLEGRAMFMGASADEFSAPWAAVAKINDPGSSHIPSAHAANILVASNGCAADSDAASCFERLETALESGVQMYKDDFLAETAEMDYWLDFSDGAPARCNEVTAPPECSAEALESLP